MASIVVLQEYLDNPRFETQLIAENKEKGTPRTYKMRGLFQKGDEPNGNHRVYPMRLLEREVERLQEAIKRRRLIGELDHPPGREQALAGSASHHITSLEVHGKEVFGEIEVIPGTDAGRNLIGLIEMNIGIGVSSRGAGGLRQMPNGLLLVEDNLKINTWDVVHEPSVREAYLHEALQTNRLIVPSRSMLDYLDKIMI